ncbi:acyl-CoA dehydrogenase family protein, partial [Pseudomonas aeruginosa]|uniref:acyl-CoA dehydrogenase family protein n=1 Tax=Pseudomonas aeruginosa TaxID=287 RepID=UPI0031B730F6
EAMEVLGGIGYCEESELPRLYREMPVNSIWEGSGNIMCLDVLRVLNKQAGVYDLLSEAFVEVKGQDRYFDRAVRRLQQQPGGVPAQRSVPGECLDATDGQLR